VRRVLITILLAGCLLLLAGSGSAPAATKATECEGEDVSVTAANLAAAERTLLCMTNVYRVANGREPLTEDPALFRAARKHSEYQEATGQLGHDDIGDGTPTQRAEAEGFDCGGPFDCVGENVMRSNFPGYTPAEILQGWKNSPGHDANLKEPNYVTAGMGLAVGGNNWTTGTQKFATVDNGATGTAADMLTNDACRAAGAALASAAKKVAKAKKRLAKAEGGAKRAKAKARLKKAKNRLGTARNAEQSACDLTY
jgi:uncharacterized protein YkwD